MKLNKPYTNTQYANLAVYCNKNGLIIEDKGDYLEAVNPPEPSVEEKKLKSVPFVINTWNRLISL